MNPLRYNPFSKHLDDLEPSDLSILRDVAEGWYVEYKIAVPSPNSIAKSISSFANTYGGWLFYGVAESHDGRREGIISLCQQIHVDFCVTGRKGGRLFSGVRN